MGAALVSSAALAGFTVHAQTLPPETPGVLLEQQRQAEEQKKKQELYIQPQVPPIIEKLVMPPSPGPGDARLVVSRITFSGNTVFKTAELERVVAQRHHPGAADPGTRADGEEGTVQRGAEGSGRTRPLLHV